MGVLDRIKTTYETKENHPLKAFQTHYFKANLKTIQELISTLVKQKGWRVETQNERFNELFIRGKKHHIIITMFKISPQETAVDIKVQVYQLLGMNQPQKLIRTVYDTIALKAPLKGTGLNLS
jgi:hypothetical protein